ncbi:hypothetical protein Zmor_013277 [Zophobas morio]|uniref:Uncharacterized protein n=1 Tax=Zophobas morio TaxID=2755281 RepID=A0AA38IF81_9CUCU|nr:hypothetical protein Zmor_013277 [Zophobas morio]
MLVDVPNKLIKHRHSYLKNFVEHICNKRSSRNSDAASITSQEQITKQKKQKYHVTKQKSEPLSQEQKVVEGHSEALITEIFSPSYDYLTRFDGCVT